ncbi:type II secretion system protein N [Leptothrix discophora]|uniref:Type II secretion system protein N n=1 Tax=Leptothrix discophora TaxID=89 RepID=A0ABT9G610_LEPDI|nr:type II secretion system protein N [Leptothrix discophora]MDP4301919.1 type II secretion system protein N [Leptothrix discophora]
MAARSTAWLVWAALAGSLVFWGLRLGVQPQGVPAQVQTVGADQSARGDILRLFANPSGPGAAPAPQQVAAASRLRLLGVVAGAGDTARGWALLAVDGQPARMIPVGAAVTDEWVVQTVSQRQVEIGPTGQPPVAVLDLPLPAAAATGTLGPAGTLSTPQPSPALVAPGVPVPPPVVLAPDGSVVQPGLEGQPPPPPPVVVR